MMRSKPRASFLGRVMFLLCTCVLVSAGQSPVDTSSPLKQRNKPVLSPTIHAAVLEAPLKSLNSKAAETIESKWTVRGFWKGLRDRWNKIFHRNKPDSTLPAPSGEPEVAEPEIDSTKEPKASEMNATEQGMMRASVSPLKTTANDIVTTRMRLTSFIESISASLEGMQLTMNRWFGHKKMPYTIVAQNGTMFLAEVPGRIFNAPKGKEKVKPVRAVFHNHKLTVEVEETAFTESTGGGKVSEEATGIGTEYHFDIKDAYVNVDDVYLRATTGGVPGYQIVVPLQKEADADRRGHAISRLVARVTEMKEVNGHWGTHREEDEYDFLHAQLACQKDHGASGIRRMLCTCEKVHLESETRRLLCTSRVADKVVRVAKENREVKIAARIYRGSIRCRNAKYGIVGSRNCLVKLLERYAGDKSTLHAKYGRNILSNDGDNHRVDEILAKQQMRQEDFLGTEENEVKVEPAVSPIARLFIFVAYLAGVALLLLCFFDARRQYRRNSEEAQSQGRPGRFPDQLQALYARLVTRTD